MTVNERAALDTLPSANSNQESPASGRTAQISEHLATWFLIALLTWVQFPFGSNRPWAWSLLSLLAAAVWLAWMPAGLLRLDETTWALRRVAVPAMALLAVITWAFLQAATITPQSWHHVIWSVLADGTAQATAGAVSMNPFETVTEAMKLSTYVAIGWLAYWLARSHIQARRIFIAVAAVGTCYAIYGMFLSAIGSGQTMVLDDLAPPYQRDVTGGFIAKNSFATFDGIALAACILLLGDAARDTVVATRGIRQLAVTLIQLFLGRAVFLVIAAVILFVALVLSDSRGGLLSTLGGLLVIFTFGAVFAARRGTMRWAVTAFAATLGAMVVLFSISGDSLQTRFDQLVETRGQEDLRPVFWDAAIHSIEDYPYVGSGLGTFRDSYNLYADRFEPYIIDRAHNDYLELALGLGIPMALLCVGALGWATLICVRGVMTRRRRRLYALGAVSATTIVALHSFVDFSLQMPAVAVLYAVVLGVGLGQAQGRSERGDRMLARGAQRHEAGK